MICLAAVSVFVAAVSVLVLAVSTFVLLYQICELCQFFRLLYRCVLLAAVSDCLATASGFCHFSVGFDQRPIGACLGGWVGSLEMSHERSWLETRFKAKALGERYSLATNVAEVACWGECCDRIPSSRAKNHKTAIRPCCTLRSVLRQDPITPT